MTQEASGGLPQNLPRECRSADPLLSDPGLQNSETINLGRGVAGSRVGAKVPSHETCANPSKEP